MKRLWVRAFPSLESTSLISRWLYRNMPGTLAMTKRRKGALLVFCILLILSSMVRRQKKTIPILPYSNILSPDPRAGTAWQPLCSSHTDRSFISQWVSVWVFELLYSAGPSKAWESTPIPRHDVPTTPKPWGTTYYRSLDTAGALGLIYTIPVLPWPTGV